MEKIINAINDLICSNDLIVFCMGAGIYFSIVTRFLQVRYLKEMVKLLFDGKGSEKGVSSFQSFAIVKRPHRNRQYCGRSY